MRGQGWDIGCLYNQETGERPQLFFSHQFKTGDPYQLAAEIRKGLNRMNVQCSRRSRSGAARERRASPPAATCVQARPPAAPTWIPLARLSMVIDWSSFSRRAVARDGPHWPRPLRSQLRNPCRWHDLARLIACRLRGTGLEPAASGVTDQSSFAEAGPS
jgi:hypothetical protein